MRVLGPTRARAIWWRGCKGSGTRRPILLLAHLDVVEARREDWSVDPFTFLEKDGYFYGRGTTDDKAMAAHFVANLIRLKQEGVTLDRDLILALTADEEGGTFNGVDWLLKNHRGLIDAEFAINEGGGGSMRRRQVPDQRSAGEREGVPGLPPRSEERRRAQFVAGQGQRDLSPGRGARAPAGVSSSRSRSTKSRATYFERSAEVESDPTRRRHARGGEPDTDLAAAARLSARMPSYNSMMRTTCVATLLEGGHATNALPQLARANVNCRILPGGCRQP